MLMRSPTRYAAIHAQFAVRTVARQTCDCLLHFFDAVTGILQVKQIQQIYTALQALRPSDGHGKGYEQWRDLVHHVQHAWPLQAAQDDAQSSFASRICSSLQQ